MVTLTKKQFKAKLTNPRLFAACRKVHQLRKELEKINWKVYSKHISKCANPRLILEVSSISPSDKLFGIGDAAFTVGKTFSFSKYDVQYVYNSFLGQFRVIIIL